MTSIQSRETLSTDPRILLTCLDKLPAAGIVLPGSSESGAQKKKKIPRLFVSCLVYSLCPSDVTELLKQATDEKRNSSLPNLDPLAFARVEFLPQSRGSSTQHAFVVASLGVENVN